GAAGDSFAVEDLRHIVRVDALDVEGDDPRTPVGGRAVSFDPRQLREPLERVGRELVLVLFDRVEATVGYVVDSSCETDRLGDRLGPSLELGRHVAPARVLEPNAADHVAAEVEWLHFLQELKPAPERPDAARPAELVGGHSHEIGGERLNVYHAVRGALGRVA